jgi:hypothetical protein
LACAFRWVSLSSSRVGGTKDLQIRKAIRFSENLQVSLLFRELLSLRQFGHACDECQHRKTKLVGKATRFLSIEISGGGLTKVWKANMKERNKIT